MKNENKNKKIRILSLAWMKEGFYGFLAGIAFFILWCFLGVMIWTLFQGMELVRVAWFIPYEQGTYMQLSGAPPFTLEWLLVMIFSQFPNGILALFWFVAIAIQVFKGLDIETAGITKKKFQDTALNPTSIGSLRKQLYIFLTYSAVLSILCIPGLRTYEILTDHTIRYMSYFDINEQSKPLADLREFTRYTSGRTNTVFPRQLWKMTFRDGTVYKLDVPPETATIRYILQFPHVTSNVEFVNGELMIRYK